MFLNDEPSMVRPTLININPVELKYYPFVIGIDKHTGSYYVFSPKICLPKETKDICIKTVNMITKKDETKAMTKYISCNFKCKFNNTTCNSIQK